ncbi:hypothetical protein FXO09_00245 [Microcystis aeruginosa KLA2]|nr:MAG: hypothetical protein EWV59_17755 [Microcystis aeruginosa Ma_MB_F_20061100_S19D]TRU10936.1 MAG: hypothetical protein EWV58_19560 [Microcystis aeruginosa Ma_MB_F_20061100_S19]TYT73052.1 hypothetical protein FXO09_00245 [Microcystis aeruginosa KLA2]
MANIFRLFCHQKSARYWSNRGEVFGTFSLKMPKIPHTPRQTLSANPRCCKKTLAGGIATQEVIKGFILP